MAPQPPHFTWRDHPCPSWCELEHQDDDHPQDRVHRGASQHALLTVGTGPAAQQDVLLTLAEQRLGEAVTVCVQQAEGPLALTLTPEGAALLRDALGHTVLAVTDGALLSPGRESCPPSSAAGSP